MIDYSTRSTKKELLDGNNIPFADIRQNMRELEFINSQLGGHAITINGFKTLLRNRKAVSVCEIGCGGGDNLNALETWCGRKKVLVSFTGIDINPNCIAYARTNSYVKWGTFITADYKETVLKTKPDIIFSSLFCHHFSDEELIAMLHWMRSNSALGFFINDLHRHPLAYHFIRLAARIFSASYLVKNDAPLSVLRGFKKKEWERLLQQAGITRYLIRWKWAFRYLLIAPHPAEN